MENYKKLNNILGWVAFLIASIVYLLTMESTVSFWDCGEFISTAYKLEVGHPPGAPFFMILGRFFTLFAGNNLELVPVTINILSALASAFTILFLFWTISHLLVKIIIKDPNSDYSLSTIIIILGSAFVGSMAYTFSDTFWFSAVEGEVYAASSLFTAIVFWAILRWENEADQKYANRWIILIAYLVGLSIGVHLLNLLAIPAIVFVYYFKKYTPTRKGVLAATLISIALLGILMYGIIPGIIKVASWFELIFVNGARLSYNSGLIIYIVLLIGAVVYGIHYTMKKGKAILNTIIIAFAVIVIGYSSYAIIIIRSLADPPMDQNNPDNLFSLLYYLNREQYGDRPLFKGKYYDAPLVNRKEGKAVYKPIDGKYEIVDYKPEYEYHEEFITFFPRMFSDDPKHIEVYEKFGKIKGRPVRVQTREGMQKIRVPTFKENLRFFFSYQLGFMYFRYFMWNFSGRQNDIQGHGNVIHGNWISGIPILDNARLGDQSLLPSELADNKARNKYYMLPFLLGLIGLIYQFTKNKRGFVIVTLLFVLTGIAIVVYLNQNPIQPRERDYAYAGSFYAYAIWIGMGVAGIFELIKNKMNKELGAGITILGCLLLVPVIMAKENWDDHNRSGRYTARDFAYNYLNSCAPNAILFTNGDNDTFPLWYAQEVEGIRTDVRVANLSYLTADWYIDQLARKAYDADAIPFSMTKDKYIRGTRDVLPVYESLKRYVDIKQIMQFITSEDDKSKIPSPFKQGAKTNFIPTKKLALKVDKDKVLENGTVDPKMQNLIVDSLKWNLSNSYLLKNKLMIIDLLATNNWERPVYYAITVSSDNYMNLQPYFQTEGLAYRIVPIKNKSKGGQIGSIHTEIMYKNMMDEFRWGGIDQEKDIYLDENNIRMLSNYRNNFARLADALYNEGKIDSCNKVINKCLELLPNEKVPYNYFTLGLVRILFKAGLTERAIEVSNTLASNKIEEIDFYLTLGKDKLKELEYEMSIGFHVLQEIIKSAKRHEQNEIHEKLEPYLQNSYNTYTSKIRN